MTRNRPSERARTLRNNLMAMGLSPKAAAERADFPYTTLMNFLNGHSQSMRGEGERKFALGLGKTVQELFDSAPGSSSALSSPQSMVGMPTASLIGVVEAGAWREAVSLEDMGERVSFVPSRKFAPEDQYALKVRGQSCSQVADDGDTVIVVPFEKIPGGLETLAMQPKPPLVIAERSRAGSFEYTMKELRHTPDGWELHPKSHHPDHQKMIALTDDGFSDTDSVRVAFVVLDIIKHYF